MFGVFLGIPAAPGRTGAPDSSRASSTRSSRNRRIRRPRALGPAPLGAAQQAVQDALLAAVGSQPRRTFTRSPAGLLRVPAAAHRFAILPASARHAWLAAHLAALRAGTITARKSHDRRRRR